MNDVIKTNVHIFRSGPRKFKSRPREKAIKKEDCKTLLKDLNEYALKKGYVLVFCSIKITDSNDLSD